jgi:hypothetical protein
MTTLVEINISMAASDKCFIADVSNIVPGKHGRNFLIKSIKQDSMVWKGTITEISGTIFSF